MKKKLAYSFMSVVLAFSFIFIISGCTSPDPIVGTWGDGKYSLTMNQDGTFIFDMVTVEATGNWTKQEMTDATDVYKLTVNEDSGITGSGWINEDGEFAIIFNVHGQSSMFRFTKEN